MKKCFKEMAAKLGLKRIGDSDYCESEPNEQGKVTIAYHDGCEFQKISEYAMKNKHTLPIHISSLNAVYLSCADGQFLINRDGAILSAPGDFARINYIRETSISKDIALLQVSNSSWQENVAIVKDMGNGEYKWGLLFPDGNGGARVIGDNYAIVKKGNDVLFLETLAKTKAYSYVVPVMMRGSPETVFLQKGDDSSKVREYEVWQNGRPIWMVDIGHHISYALFVSGRPWMAQIKCWGAEGLIDVKRKEVILPAVYKKVSVEEGDFAYVITHDGAKCLYDLAEDKWIVSESDGWMHSEKRKGVRIFAGEFKRRAVFCYKERELRG
ncbi:MAG: hypothetical protein LBH25_01055 [Fibromonadaceae bacterium]|jgi:hypothetical protein|nr:hypothetical protein [Fibromonadaceae bacterium]